MVDLALISVRLATDATLASHSYRGGTHWVVWLLAIIGCTAAFTAWKYAIVQDYFGELKGLLITLWRVGAGVLAIAASVAILILVFNTKPYDGRINILPSDTMLDLLAAVITLGCGMWCLCFPQ